MSTELLERPIASGSTLYQPPRRGVAARAASDFYERGVPFEPMQRMIQIEVADPALSWLGMFMQDRVNALLRLGVGWDGGKARPVTYRAAHVAIDIALTVAGDVGIPPQVFPLVDGGLQLEWHAAGHSLEIEVDQEGDAHVYAVAPDGSERINETLAVDPPLNIAQAKKELREIAVRVAQAG